MISKLHELLAEYHLLVPAAVLVVSGVIWLSFRFTKLGKFLRRYFSGESEIARICRAPHHNGQMTHAFRLALISSRQLTHVQKVLFNPAESFDEAKVCDMITRVKPVRTDAQLILMNMRLCIRELAGINDLIKCVTSLAAEPYTATPENERILAEIWDLLRPGVTRHGGRYTKDWVDIGFQGEDPATDFRAMGVLGLQTMYYIASSHTTAARGLVEEAIKRPLHALPFAITVINFTAEALRLLQSRKVDKEFYLVQSPHNDIENHPSLVWDTPKDEERATHTQERLHRFYELTSRLLFGFAEDWRRENPSSIMQFETLRARYVSKWEVMLDQGCSLLTVSPRSTR
eukprot:TRINITY_DN286_c0_g1::TRINITY_DN286_c0_g1_i1::g.1596::m.1596 TRINITY_DN286_c0_g1::TRINITY_DN286_c0_g1_i1::g.1596  ORF type:complete len:345 (+),score=44.70,sp/Q54VR8/ELMOB_DICDI/31.33/1e-30,ELMO_CED12/PF04727.8/5.4e-30 TRINITY_DN286_c0_g1_i1:97-1131(+)